MAELSTADNSSKLELQKLNDVVVNQKSDDENELAEALYQLKVKDQQLKVKEKQILELQKFDKEVKLDEALQKLKEKEQQLKSFELANQSLEKKLELLSNENDRLNREKTQNLEKIVSLLEERHDILSKTAEGETQQLKQDLHEWELAYQGLEKELECSKEDVGDLWQRISEMRDASGQAFKEQATYILSQYKDLNKELAQVGDDKEQKALLLTEIEKILASYHRLSEVNKQVLKANAGTSSMQHKMHSLEQKLKEAVESNASAEDTEVIELQIDKLQMAIDRNYEEFAAFGNAVLDAEKESLEVKADDLLDKKESQSKLYRSSLKDLKQQRAQATGNKELIASIDAKIENLKASHAG